MFPTGLIFKTEEAIYFSEKGYVSTDSNTCPDGVILLNNVETKVSGFSFKVWDTIASWNED